MAWDRTCWKETDLNSGHSDIDMGEKWLFDIHLQRIHGRKFMRKHS